MNDMIKAILDEAYKQGYSTGDLAMYSGLSDTAITGIISGRTKHPNMKTVMCLAEAVGLAVVAKLPGEETYTKEINAAMRCALWASDKPKNTIMLESGVDKEVIKNIEQGAPIRYGLATWEKLATVLGVELALVKQEDMSK